MLTPAQREALLHLKPNQDTIDPPRDIASKIRSLYENHPDLVTMTWREVRNPTNGTYKRHQVYRLTDQGKDFRIHLLSTPTSKPGKSAAERFSRRSTWRNRPHTPQHPGPKPSQ